MRMAVLGASGQLGTDLVRCLPGAVPLTRAELDVTDHERARTVLLELKPGVVINTTAYHRVDECESQPMRAYETNAVAVLNLARVCNALDATLVHYTTDYVFGDGATRPYTETDPVDPLSVYANSKVAGEFLALHHACRPVVIRTCGLFGLAGIRSATGNFVEAMVKRAAAGAPLRVVSDQVVSPTPSADLAVQTLAILESGATGLFHASAEGQCSWFEFARAIFDISGIQADLTPTTAREFNAPARRPNYSVLENARLKAMGIHRMRHWRDGLASYLEARTRLV